LFNLETIRGGLIISCQPEGQESFYTQSFACGMAAAAELGGAVALRLNSPETIRAVRSQTQLPIIGLWKQVHTGSDVYITPTLAAAEAILAAGADMIALDATQRIRPGAESLKTMVSVLKSQNAQLMADISTLEEALWAQELGFDCVGTTLAGYTPYSRQVAGPDFELLQILQQQVSCPIILEGRIWTPEEAQQGLILGAHAVVVGSAITRPHLIARRFVEALNGAAS
jgi:N-acylglucosamine-6-phosphate 2-epimerase